MAPRQPTRLIINGDDFGKSREVNEAVVRAFLAGTLTSCSLMVTGEAFDHAVESARNHPGLAVGIHLVTVNGRSVLPHREIPHLVDQRGFFPRSPVLAGLRYYFCRTARSELHRELSAQMGKFFETGLQPSHIDSHLHLHIHPVVFEIACSLGERFGVRRMRVPHDDFRLLWGFSRTQALGKVPYALVFELFARRMKRVLTQRRFAFPCRVYGNFLSGGMSLDYVLFILDRLDGAPKEIYFHPCYGPPATEASPETLQGLREFAVLTHPAVIARLKRPHILPSNYRQLKAEGCSQHYAAEA